MEMFFDVISYLVGVLELFILIKHIIVICSCIMIKHFMVKHLVWLHSYKTHLLFLMKVV